ncbi:hypothetical protein PLESTM_000020500 [Pleodorina starrii]|nr:hypothetical protein PLESTM_000020500 [Pleodorina starrii]
MWGFIQSASRMRAHPLTQLAVTGALSAIVGFTLQITKLSALDSSGRQFDQGTYAGKVGFLAVFGVNKAFANLSVGWLVTRLGYVRTELAGWVLGLAMPLTLALAATAGADGDAGAAGASGAAGWRAVMFANVVLGLQQGLCWSVTVLMMILLMPDTRRGLASGLNETLGYAAVASAAPVYGILESRLVRCGWALPAAQLSAACRAAVQPLLGGMAADPGAPADPNTAALPALDLEPSACTSPDTWDPACLGECQCRGYDRLLIAALLVLLPSGLAVTALLLVEPSPAAAYLPVSAAAADGVRTEDECKAGFSGSGGGGGGVGSRDAEDGAPVRRGPRAWLAALRQSLARSMSYDGGGYGMSYKHLPPEQAAETRRLLTRAPPQPQPEATGSSSSASGAARVSKDMELATRDGPHHPPVRFQQQGDGPAEPQTAVSLDVDGGRQSPPGLSSAVASGGGAGTGGDWLSSAARFGSAFLHYSWHNPSTAAMCLAGATSNALTSLAWGLLLTWARDSLGVPGPGRNLITAAYSFLKGLVQLLSGAASDAAGRKAPVLVGLALNAAGLLTCACGAGWGGWLLGLGRGAAGGGEAGSGSGCDEGERARRWKEHGGGVVAGEHSVAAAMATYRFWRDLGYALGALGGPVADVVGVEVTLLVAAAACLAVAGVVLVRYEERVPVAAAKVKVRE